MNKTDELLPVTQGDREAALACLMAREDFSIKFQREMLEGKRDVSATVQAFARHRIASQDSQPTPSESLASQAKVDNDGLVEELARQALFGVETARTEIVNPVNGARPYSYVAFAGARIEFQQDDNEVKYHCGNPIYDAATDKAAAQARRINDMLFDVAKRAATTALRNQPSDSEALSLLRDEACQALKDTAP